MQIQSDDIRGREPLLRQVGKRQFVNHATAGEADSTLLAGRWMCGDHDPVARAIRSEREIWAVVLSMLIV
jgi:hypothetical protein